MNEDKIQPPAGSPEVRPGWMTEDDQIEWERSTEREASEYYREQALFDAGQYAYDNAMPRDRGEGGD